ncbi:MAG TPA: zinc ribbon domain-containing protein [Streptosporangiaceae bacterium]|nr:zinc ribbon domain-containing protein [Streptosporangiaceae bacterium]
MNCTACGNPVPADTTSCPRCGTALALRAPAGTTTAFRFDASRLTSADRLIGVGTLALLISLFLPWYGVTVLGFSAQADGLTGHGYLYVVLIICLAIAGYLVAYAGMPLPAIPLTHRQRLLAATGLNGVIVLLAFLVKPGDSGWRFGAFLGLLAAIVAVVGAARA